MLVMALKSPFSTALVAWSNLAGSAAAAVKVAAARPQVSRSRFMLRTLTPAQARILYPRNLGAAEGEAAECARRHAELGDEGAMQVALVDEAQVRGSAGQRAALGDQRDGPVQAALAQVIAGRQAETFAEGAREVDGVEVGDGREFLQRGGRGVAGFEAIEHALECVGGAGR